MPTKIKGQPTSEEALQFLRSLDEPVFLSFSCGKDSIATWIAMHKHKIPVLPVYFYTVPGLRIVQESIDYFENYFGQEIPQYPHPSLYRMLEANVYQTPERLKVLDNAQLPVPDLTLIWEEIKSDYGLPGTYVADGVRAADSIVRRASLTKHGVIKKHSKKVSPIADWLKAEVMQCLEDNNVKLPVDYKLWGRSLDGLDARFMKPLKEHYPDDYERVAEYFPLIELDLLRGETYGL